MDNEVDIESIRQNLIDADCDEKTINQFMKLMETGKLKEQLRLLSCHRCNLLCEVHKQSEKIDCLDFLISKLNKQRKESCGKCRIKKEGVCREEDTNHIK